MKAHSVKRNWKRFYGDRTHSFPIAGLQVQIFYGFCASMVWNAGVVNELKDSNLGTARRKLLKFQGGSEVFRTMTVSVAACDGI